MKVNISFNDGTYKYLQNPSGQKIAGLTTVMLSKGGKCRVTYSEDFYNEFEFTNKEDFKNKIIPCLDIKLVKEFK